MMEDQTNRDAWVSIRVRAIGDQARALVGVDGGRAVAGWHGLLGALMLAVVLVGWRYYAGWSVGRVEFVTEGEPVVAQVLEEELDNAVGEPFDLAGRVVVGLQEGEYRLRVAGTGRLGRIFRFAVVRGQTQRYSVSIDEGRLLRGEGSRGSRVRAGIRFAELSAALELTPGKADLIEWTDAKTVICRDGVSSEVRWDASRAVKPREGADDAIEWLRTNTSWGDAGAGLLEGAPDLNGDGIGDLVWYSGRAVELLAASGKDGSTLWRYRDGGGTEHSSSSRNAGAPAILDLDGDEAPDVIATFRDYGYANDRFVVSAVSGRTGRRIWTYPRGQTMSDSSRVARDRPAVVVKGRRSTLIAYVNETRWLGLDPASGQVQAGPIELGFIPVRPVQHADLDGDGEPELIALGPGATGTQRTLRVVSIKNARELWVQTVDGGYDQSERGVPPGDCPLAVDLDGDGRSEIVVSDAGAMPPLPGYRGVRALDGLAGTTRWHRPLRPETSAKDGLAQLVAAPDVDGDGTREVIAISLFDGQDPPASPRNPADRRLYVDAMSGRDGRALWVWTCSLPVATFTRIWAPQWWGHGRDGLPMLAVALGGSAQPRLGDIAGISCGPPERLAEPEVHVLEASTGAERHRVPGLARVKVADLDGDGMTDLWGNVEGELRAFRGEMPEAWRALGRFSPAGSLYPRPNGVEFPGVDLDGDGVADTLGEPEVAGFLEGEAEGCHVAVARSGRDGHVIWTTVLDPWDHWTESKCRDWYELEALGSPDGDLDGDGTADVIARKLMWEPPSSGPEPLSAVPVQVLSGRTGARLWSAGPLPSGIQAQVYNGGFWVQAFAVERGSGPDLIVRHHARPATAVPGVAAVPMPGRASLARISGRDGRVLWEIALAEQVQDYAYTAIPPLLFADLNGDGAQEGLVLLESDHVADESDYRLQAISLRDGARLWTRPMHFDRHHDAEYRARDIDGDGRPEVVVLEVYPVGDGLTAEVRALAGRDGTTRWTWKPDSAFQPDRSKSLVLADFAGDGSADVCVGLRAWKKSARIVVLDGNGHEYACRDVDRDEYPSLKAADVNCDGRDELIVWFGGKLHALDRDLKEVWSSATRSTRVERILAPWEDGGPAAVFIKPAVAIDGATGRPRWKGQAGFDDDFGPFVPDVLDAGAANRRMPLLIGNGLGATVCRTAMGMDAEGGSVAGTGPRVKPARLGDDPRWRRPLPWFKGLTGVLGPWGFLGAFGLALLNVGVPVLILRVVCGGRRAFRMWVLMMVPIVATVPLLVFLTFSRQMPVVGTGGLLGSGERVFLIGTLAGLPIVWCVWSVGKCVARRRWRPVLALAGLGLVGTAAIAAGWIWVDRRSMAGIEHYGWEGWELVFLVGGYVAALIWGVGVGVDGWSRGLNRWERRSL